jgi:hypothetical protein
MFVLDGAGKRISIFTKRALSASVSGYPAILGPSNIDFSFGCPIVG